MKITFLFYFLVIPPKFILYFVCDIATYLEVNKFFLA